MRKNIGTAQRASLPRRANPHPTLIRARRARRHRTIAHRVERSETRDEPPHRSEPWVVLPTVLTSAARAVLTELDRERLPMPAIVKPIAPYLGDGGIALWWREESVSVGGHPAVLLTLTLVSGTTCTVFEDDASERELHVAGHDVAAVTEAHDFIAAAVRWWASRRG